MEKNKGRQKRFMTLVTLQMQDSCQVSSRQTSVPTQQGLDHHQLALEHSVEMPGTERRRVSRPQSAGYTRMKKSNGTFARSKRSRDGERPSQSGVARSSFHHNQNMTMQDIILHGPTHIDRSIIRPASAANQRLRERNLEGEVLLMSKKEREMNEAYVKVAMVERERMQLIERQLDMKRRTLLQDRRVALERKAGVRPKSRGQHGVEPFFNSITDIKGQEDVRPDADGYTPIFRQPQLTATMRSPIRPRVSEQTEDRSGSIHAENWRTVGRTDVAAFHDNVNWKNPYKSAVAFMRISAKTGVNLDEIAEQERKRKERTMNIRQTFRKQKHSNDVKTAHIEAVFSRPDALIKARSIALMKQRGEHDVLALTGNLEFSSSPAPRLHVDPEPSSPSPSSASNDTGVASTSSRGKPRPQSASLHTESQARPAAARPFSAATTRVVGGQQQEELATTRRVMPFNHSSDAIVTRVRSRPVSALASSHAREVLVRTGDVQTRDGRVLRNVTVPRLSERMEMIALPKPFRETPCHPMPVTLATDSTEIDLKGLNVPEELRVANRNADITPLRQGCSVCALKRDTASNAKTLDGKIVPASIVHNADEVVRYFHERDSLEAKRRTNYSHDRANGNLLKTGSRGKMVRPLTSSGVLSGGVRAHDTARSVKNDIDAFEARLSQAKWHAASRTQLGASKSYKS